MDLEVDVLAGSFADDVCDMLADSVVSADAAATRPAVDLPGLDLHPSPPPIVDLADLGREFGVPADGCGGRDDVLADDGGFGAD